MLSSLNRSAGLAGVFVILLAVASVAPRPTAQSIALCTSVTLVRVPEGGLQPQVAVDARGGVHLVYFKGEAANGDVFYTRLGADGTTFAPALRVNSQPGSAIATGNMRGAHLAIGRNGRVHVSWNGSSRATPRGVADTTPMLYARSNGARTAFDPQRNLAQFAVDLDGGAIAADEAGHVYVAWHAGIPGAKGEADRRLWVTRSTDDGTTFAREQFASDAETGACGCCGVGALADRRGSLYLLYRSAREVTHRDAYLLTSKNAGVSFTGARLQEWNVGGCPMSTFALSEGRAGILAAWETGGQVQFVRIDAETQRPLAIVEAPGEVRTRKHPAVAGNARGEVLFVWTEGMAWQRGGSVVWQIFDREGKPTAEHGRRDGVPVWSLVAAYTRPDGGFTILY